MSPKDKQRWQSTHYVTQTDSSSVKLRDHYRTQKRTLYRETVGKPVWLKMSLILKPIYLILKKNFLGVVGTNKVQFKPDFHQDFVGSISGYSIWNLVALRYFFLRALPVMLNTTVVPRFKGP
jgi:hypothetical protein